MAGIDLKAKQGFTLNIASSRKYVTKQQVANNESWTKTGFSSTIQMKYFVRETRFKFDFREETMSMTLW